MQRPGIDKELGLIRLVVNQDRMKKQRGARECKDIDVVRREEKASGEAGST